VLVITQYHSEREHNARLMEYIARAEQIELTLRTENEVLRSTLAHAEGTKRRHGKSTLVWEYEICAAVTTAHLLCF
jgi:hypothetical protein